MMNNSMSTREYILFGILDQLLVLADKGCDAASLASRLDVEVADIEGGLTHLRGRGLIQEKQLRLTMSARPCDGARSFFVILGEVRVVRLVSRLTPLDTRVSSVRA